MAGPGAAPELPFPAPVRAFGQSALVVPVGGPHRAAALAGRVREARWPAVVDVVSALDTVTVVLEPGRRQAELAPLATALAGWAKAGVGAGLVVGSSAGGPEGSAGSRAGGPAGGGGGRTRGDGSGTAGVSIGERRHEVPTVFAGADLDAVGRSTGIGADGVVQALTSVDLEVAFLGFSPGFAYLTGLPDVLAAVPRQPSPRPAVPAGSVAVAGGFAAVYPSTTPGGWQLLGQTAVTLFDPQSPPFAVLAPGDRVRFVPVAAADAAHDPGPPIAVHPGDGHPAADLDSLLTAEPGPGGPPTSDAGPGGRDPAQPVFRVEMPGPLTTVQDGGRPGFAHLGVPRSGPADPVAHALANRLVGNPPTASALEVTAQGPVLRCLADTHVAVVGGHPPVRLDGRAVPAEAVVPVVAGQLLEVGVAASLRGAVAVAGGVARAVPTDRAVGSLATDVLAGLGTPPLRTGDVLWRIETPGPLGGRLAPEWDREEPDRSRDGHGDGWCLRVLPGPHLELFGDDVPDGLAARRFLVDPASNRVGLRLRPAGEGADGGVIPRRSGELASQGMVTGAVQVPPDGAPVVLLPDHATHGGYPVLAVVIDADLPVLGRCRPGDAVRFVPVSRATAEEAWRSLARAVDAAVTGRFPVEAG